MTLGMIVGCSGNSRGAEQLNVSGSTTILPIAEQAGEFGRTNELFTSRTDQRTEDYITGRFG